MDAPPDWIIDVARETALASPCLKSRRGVVLFSPSLEERRVANGIKLGRAVEGTIIASRGFNGPPGCEFRNTFYCTGTAGCRLDCAKLCIHAEDRAIRAAGALDDVRDLELVHVKVVDGQVVAGGGPSCWQCSRLVVDVGLRGVWLYELPAGNLTGHDLREVVGTWRFYTADEFHRETLRMCQLGDEEFHR